ncbi:right-handed parallel beta-helix repeat-containing protein [Actinomycetes bacterium NPDC127524]
MMRKYGAAAAALLLSASMLAPKASAAAAYTITPSSKTFSGNMMNFSTYNSNTKHYYLLRSYLEQLEKKGGGTLTLNGGTYTMSNTLYVPSNVTIRLKNGVRLVKGTVSGTKQFAAAKSMFQLIRPSRSGKKGVYGKYNGEKNISFIGEGNAVIDMKYDNESIAIIMGHNKNVKVQNIHFQHMKSGHFIEMDASDHVSVTNNSFIDSKPSPNRNKEAINLDTPDRSTKGWSQEWSTYDKTANRYVTIESNTFRNLDRAIGTHKYSGGSYHDHVTIRKNSITTTRLDAIRVMNWSNALIEKNSFKDVAGGDAKYRGILASGASNPIFQNNTFEHIGRPMQFLAAKNDGPGSQYAITYNTLSQKNMDVLKTNTVKNTSETFIRINHFYNVYNDTIKIPCLVEE